jgi:hypothetical protein
LPTSRLWISSRTGRDLAVVACTALIVSALWIACVPPFEGLDELYFYNRASQFSAQPSRSEPLFYRLAAMVLRVEPRPAGPVEPRYNPAFDFVGNTRGTVARFEHERPVAPRGHLRALYALRALVAALSVLTALCIYGIARLSLERADAALSVALICILIPQVSFMNATVHGEAVTRLFGAAVTLVVVAGLVGRIGRPLMWAALACLVVATPLIDRQGIFVIALAGAGVVMAETTWRRRTVAVLALAVPAVVMVQFVARYNESGNLGPWFQLLRHPLRPLFYADPGLGSTAPPGAAYYVFEFLPKLFLGFWGWLGQPSILLHPALYAAFAVMTIVGAAGAVFVMVSGRSPIVAAHPHRLAALRVLAFGIAAMCVPIAYGPAVAGRNLWYGRWLFPMIGPIVILLGVGWAAALETPARRRRAAIALGILGAVAGALWITPPGDAFRITLRENHYGDQAHLIHTAGATIVALLAAAAGFELAVRMPSLVSVARQLRTPAIAAAALNGLVLIAVVGPLYAPLTADDYVGVIRREVNEGRLNRAADTYASAAQAYPQSETLRALASEVPRLLISARLDEMSGLFEDLLARGLRLDDRDSLLALAHHLRASAAGPSDAIERAIDNADSDPDLSEPAELVRVVLNRAAMEPSAALRVIRAGGGRSLQTPMRHGEAMLEGATAHVRRDGRVQAIVYYRPLTDWTNRRLWLHAYPGATTESYLDPEPVITGSRVPKPGELDWAVFELPPGRYQGYVGIWVGTGVGSGYPIGALP